MQLYIIRHGQSFNNALWFETGSANGRLADPHLTEKGQQQANHLARYLAQADKKGFKDAAHDQHNRHGYHLTHLYSSLMYRAVQTGHAIAEALDMPLLIWESIHEWGGLYLDDPETNIPMPQPGPNRTFFAHKFPRLEIPDWLQEEGWWGQRPYEHREDSIHRAQQFIEDLIERHGDTDDRVAIITHGGFTSMILRTIFNFKENEFSYKEEEYRTWLRLNNTGIIRLDFESARILQIYTNRIDHLPTDLIT